MAQGHFLHQHTTALSRELIPELVPKKDKNKSCLQRVYNYWKRRIFRRLIVIFPPKENETSFAEGKKSPV